MSVHQISVILKEVRDETQYYFNNPIKFYIEANEQDDSILRIASTLCVAHKNNELLLETVNASATPIILKQGKIMGKAFIASETLSHIPAIHNIEIRSFISGDAAIQDPDSDKDSLLPLLLQSDEDT